MMKAMKFTHLLVLALALTLTAIGCKHKPTPLTPLPGQRVAAPTGPGPRDIDQGGRAKPDERVEPGRLPTTDTWQVEDMNPDRAALAADTVHFDFDSAVVKSSEMRNVEAVATALKADANAKLLIEGHCDERGTEEYNRALGERRALALREALARADVDPNRIRTISYGKDKPVDNSRNDAAYARNRRGEFVLLHPKT